jgi:hypothetical protein
MKPFLVSLVLCPLLTFSAFAQTPLPPQQPLSQVKQFLGLTDSQVSAIIQNNNDYNTFSFQQQQTIQHAQAQIAVETAQDQLDPVAIGSLYAGIESACRDLRSKAARSQQQNLSLLTDVQRAKLNMLNDAMKLAPIISEAQSGNLLGSVGSAPYSFDTGSTFTATYAGFSFNSGVSGCGVNGGIGGGLGGILPQPLPSPTQPGVAGLSTAPAPANDL